jgi:hypothetical protein
MSKRAWSTAGAQGRNDPAWLDIAVRMKVTAEEPRMPARRADATIKACRAVELVRQGQSYEQVARAVGFANRGTAHRVVTKALADRLVDGIDDLRHSEVARLDALQAALWPKVERGDVRAVNTVMRIIHRRSRLLGLYTTTEVEAPLRGLVVPEPEGNVGTATGADAVGAGVGPVAAQAA